MRLRRLGRYILVMFPPLLAVLGAFAFLSIWLVLQAVAGTAPLHLGVRGSAGMLTVSLWLLLVRLLDDLRDATEDRRLALAGDPRYRDRPTVTGAITLPEIRGLVAGVAAAIVVINLLPASPTLAVAAPALLLLTWLSFHWFFIPGLRRNPGPLMYLARKSLSVLLGIYALVVFRDQWPGATVGSAAVPLLIAPVLEIAAWETGRKIRLPHEETSYPTYSQLVGWRAAALLPVLFVSLAAACLVVVARVARLGWSYEAVVLAGFVVVLTAAMRLWARPTPSHAKLEPSVRVFAALAHGGLIVALVREIGVGIR